MLLGKNKFVWVLAAAWLMSLSAWAQGGMPVHFTVQQQQKSPTEVEVVFTGTIDAGWHVYSTDLGDGGPVSATYNDEQSQGAKPVGKLIAKGKEVSEDDKIFGMRVRFFERQVTFVQKYQVTEPEYHIKGYLEYGACNDQMCMPPTSVEADFTGKGPEKTAAAPAEKTQQEPEAVAPVVPAEEVVAIADTLPAAVDTIAAAALTVDTLSADARHNLWWIHSTATASLTIRGSTSF